jgi:uncharacterized membrane protein YvlD (DUF360 family)
MKTWGIRIGLALVANIITLWIASIIPGFHINNFGAFVIAAIIFTLATLFVKPIIVKFLTNQAGKYSSRSKYLAGKSLTYIVGIVATGVIVWLTWLISRGIGFNVFGFIIGTIIIWAASLVYDIVDDRLEARVGAIVDDVADKRKAP